MQVQKPKLKKQKTYLSTIFASTNIYIMRTTSIKIICFLACVAVTGCMQQAYPTDSSDSQTAAQPQPLEISSQDMKVYRREPGKTNGNTGTINNNTDTTVKEIDLQGNR